MLTIRAAQIRVLALAALPALVKRLSASVTEDHAELAQRLGAASIEAVVTEGITAALGHGFDLEEDVTVFVYLMFTFGRHFDTDPGYPWAASHLAEVASDPTAIARLIRAAGEFEHLGRGLMSNTDGDLIELKHAPRLPADHQPQ